MDKVTGEWLSVKAAAELKGVSKEAVMKRIRSGVLPAQWAGSVYIIRRGDLESWKPRRAARARQEEAKDGVE
jgi:excisionase family DNA binding protein